MTLPAPSKLFESAVAHHVAGRREQAEAAYRQVLVQDPRHADALHMLGVLAFDVGNKEAALQLITRAISLNPQKWEYFSNLGLVLVHMGRNEEAVVAYQQSLKMNPDNLAAYHNVGSACQNLGRFDEAIDYYQQAIARQPDSANTWLNLGQVFTSQEKPDEAIKAFTEFSRLQPTSPQADYYLGNALANAGRFPEAIEPLFRCLVHQPRDPIVHNNLGLALQAVGREGEAVTAHSMALSIDPNVAMYHRNLGTALDLYLRFPEALVAYQRAVELEPDNVDYLNSLAGALRRVGQTDEALACYQKLLSLVPNSPVVFNNLANTYKDMGQVDEAIAWYDKALAAAPECAPHHSNRVYLMHFHPGYDAQTILREHRRWDEMHAQPLKKLIKPIASDRNPNRRLRIGYVSPDFRDHVVGQNLLPLLQNHDHTRFEIYCYSNVERPDEMTAKFKACADGWRQIRGVDDAAAAGMVRADQIDILIDLALHMGDNRLLLFAYKPAPIQATFGGYPGGTGLSTMDYRIGDVYLDPPEFDSHHVEKTIRLADSWWCYDPVAMALANGPDPGPLPAAQNGYVTFGCLNNFCKVNDGVLELWSRVLAAVPNSRMTFITAKGSTRDRLSATFKSFGIDPARLDYLDRQDHGGYYKLYQKIDIGLDTLPYNGHTTNLDSFWMGVPVVTLLGSTVVGRAGWSQLCNLNLRELAAKTAEEFVAIAAGLAGDLPRLADLRSRLRGRMLASPLGNPLKFARNMEAVLRQMWQDCCGSQST